MHISFRKSNELASKLLIQVHKCYLLDLKIPKRKGSKLYTLTTARHAARASPDKESRKAPIDRNTFFCTSMLAHCHLHLFVFSSKCLYSQEQ